MPMDLYNWDNVRNMPPRPSTPVGVEQLRSDVTLMKAQVGRLMLLNQALWELLQARVGLTEEELLRVVNEVDLRDGKADGQLTEHPVRCPKCERINTSRHAKCLYCGQEFEGDLFATMGK